MTRCSNGKSREFLEYLEIAVSEIVSDEMGRLRLSGEPLEYLPQRAADRLSGRVADAWGGAQLYIQKDLSHRAACRNEAVYAEFTGNNHLELALKHKISVSTVYAIIKQTNKMKRKKMMENQG